MAISEYLRNLRAKIGHEMVFMPSITAVVFNDQGEVLLQRAKDDGQWYLIGGSVDPGEEPAETVVREVWEETGVDVVPERIIGVYCHPPTRYPNGDAITYLAISFRCTAMGGEPHVHDDESLEVCYFPLDNLPPLNDSHQLCLKLALRDDPQAYFRFSASKVAD
jgi:8-oxo-dGTP pyrophosphatase MutT (NUDIX family)